MALPNSNISVAMVKAELGAATNDVGQLCIHPNINKWSKRKPVKFPTVVELTYAQLQSVNFGLSAPSNNTNYQNVIGVKWIYNKPTGGSSEPFRLSDFGGYDKEAAAIITIPDGVAFNRSSVSNYMYQIAINRGGASSTSIGIDDFTTAIGNMYAGVIVVKGGLTYMVTAPDTLANSGGSITFNTSTPPFNTDGSGLIYNILSTQAVPSVMLLQNVSPAPLFTSVPVADNANDTISLTITSGIGVVFNVTRLRDTATGLYYFIDDYIGKNALRLVTAGGLFFQVDLVNSSSNSIVIQKSLLTMNANPTYFGANTNYFAMELYSGTTPVNEIVVPGNTTVTARMGVVDLLNRNGQTIQQPLPTAKSDALVTIRYNGVNTFTANLLFSAT
jgi:hypothetical protein